jgi:hypothetical protein
MSGHIERMPPAGPAWVAAWVGSPALHDLVLAFAGTPEDRRLARDLRARAVSLPRRLARLDAFTERWDTRRGRERHQAAPLELTAHQEEVALAAAEELGMRGSSETRFPRYDHLLILGGTVFGCLVRTARAAALLRSGRVEAGTIVALGSHRPFTGGEFGLTEAAGVPHLTEEFAALDHYARQAFGLPAGPDSEVGESSPLPGATWGVRRYRTAQGLPVHVVAAPSSLPARRANTADTYRFFARAVAELRPGQRLLIVTSAINVPAQHAAALRELALPYGAEVDTVGHQAQDVPAALAREYGAADVLREVRSTVRSMRLLVTESHPASKTNQLPGINRHRKVR